MKKINIIQFLPYFPPHSGGIETISKDFSFFYVKNGYGDVINIVFDIGQGDFKLNLKNTDSFINSDGKIIGYKQDGYIVYLLPAFDIINNFPFPKFWDKNFWKILKIVKNIYIFKLQDNFSFKNTFIVQTHTRFFISSILGGIFAKFLGLKWIHIEHGSDYVKLGSSLKTKIAYFYDKIFGKIIFFFSNEVVAISEGVRDFIIKEFLNRKINIIYNGINFNPGQKINNGNVIKIGFVGRLVSLKGVDLLLESFKKLTINNSNLQLIIVGDGEEKKNLQNYVMKNNMNNISFLGFKDRSFIESNFLPSIDILVNPSFQEGLPTIVLEGLISKCLVIATNVGGTKEISNENDLIIIEKGSISELEKALKIAILSYKINSGKSYSLIKEKFNWDKNIEKYFNLYNSL